MRHFYHFIVYLFIATYASCAFSDEQKPTYAFKEVWAYLMTGEENFLTGLEPITDLAYFSVTINEIGKLNGVPDKTKILSKTNKTCRIHLVVSAPSNQSLMYWALSKDEDTRSNLIFDILNAAKPFDGLQIDFETIRSEDGQAYWDFLKELKSKLPKNKIFSVAIPARTKETKDAFDYQQISHIADKVIIMAYDEHWRTGPPGPVASLTWCKNVCNYSLEAIPVNKVVMGIPFYGRVWQKEEIARALKYCHTLNLLQNYQIPMGRDDDGIPYFEFQQTVNAVGYFDDAQSWSAKLSYYQKAGVTSIGFWRLGQESITFWDLLK